VVGLVFWSHARDRVWQAVVLLMFPGCWPVAGLAFACGMCSWLGTSELLDVQKTVTYEINYIVFMVSLMALKNSLLMCLGCRFNIQQLYVLPTQCIYVFCVDLKTNSHYFPIQH
jgi:hypothetical protein